MADYWYRCVNKHCREYRRQRKQDISPVEIRRATGRSAACRVCGWILLVSRNKPA
jgi:hypothetical protein